MVQVEPLSKMPDGTTRKRWDDVEAQIAKRLEMTQSERLAHLKHDFSETLVYFVCRTPRGDEKAFGELLKELVRRATRTARSCVRGVENQLTAMEIVEDVEHRILSLLLSKEPSLKRDFLEISFAGAVEKYTFNRLRDYERLLLRGRAKFIETQDDDGNGVERPVEVLPFGGPGPEDVLLNLNDRKERHRLLRIACQAVEDRLTLKLLILHHGHGWPVKSTDRDRATLVRACGLSERTIYRMLAEGMAAMRKALNVELSTGRKGEAQ